ncbi:flagellar M-ring protein FliF [Nitrosospira sp. Nsp5]|uniref:Flagellar M-ring protein n=1 Tax=Nitrosospira multiformis TaxID=1231 RepID=A0ABY0TE62_9PROT|nr:MULTISPECIES: flagellar basal-body MS-ring/collar protein FliF [Nitrosospira]PTR09036.1 flagellar M-ring protein FliF [Nitrosospira sp. Nsp5]SDQ69494.1 flagellar M-ring protein FliF [Nitrosospira multiformis]
MTAGAEAVAVSSPMSLSGPQIFLSRMSSQQKMGFMLAVSAIIALLAGGWMWSQAPDYKVLFSNVSDRDGGAIIAALQQMNVPYKYADGGGAILVPAKEVHDARLKLAAQGLPKGGLVGFELMENQKFGTSQFLEQVNFQRALEGELARSVQALAAVSSARVHLAMAKQSVFMREQQKPSASVLVNLYAGRTLDSQQVNAIVHLVSSSVPNLPIKNVTVVDQTGSLLSKTDEANPGTGLDPNQLKYVQALEQSYVKRIEAILIPIVGQENVRAQVAADVDFAHSEQMDERYKPNQTPESAALRSQQTSESMTSGQGEGGVPGALSNQPPASATAPITTTPATPPNQAPIPGTPGAPAQAGGEPAVPAVPPPPVNTRKDATTNYEVDKTIQHVRKQVGGIRRLSVAVVVNHRRVTDEKGITSMQPLGEAEKAQIMDLVKEAMGFSRERGDTLNVVNSPFTDIEKESVPELPLWQQPEMIELAKEIGKNVLIGALILYLVLGVLRPMLKRMNQPPAQAPALLTGNNEDQEMQSTSALNQAPQLSQYDEKLALARQLARDDPKMVASVVKKWVAGHD